MQRYRADGLALGTTVLDAALTIPVLPGGIAFGFHGYTPSTYARLGPSGGEQVLALVDRWFARYVHGGNAGDFDGDGRSDLFCYRPASGRVYVRTTSGESSYLFADHNLPVRSGVPALLDYDGGRPDGHQPLGSRHGHAVDPAVERSAGGAASPGPRG